MRKSPFGGLPSSVPLVRAVELEAGSSWELVVVVIRCLVGFTRLRERIDGLQTRHTQARRTAFSRTAATHLTSRRIYGDVPALPAVTALVTARLKAPRKRSCKGGELQTQRHCAQGSAPTGPCCSTHTGVRFTTVCACARAHVTLNPYW